MKTKVFFVFFLTFIAISCFGNLTEGVLAADKQPVLAVGYGPSPPEVVEKMLEMAKVTKHDVVYELGCGDGRIAIAAAKRGARVVCVDLDPERIAQARANATTAGVVNLITFRLESFFETDVSRATVVTLFLSPEVNLKLRPQLTRQLRSGSRIVSHWWDMGEWEPRESMSVDAEDEWGARRVYLWVTDGKIH